MAAPNRKHISLRCDLTPTSLAYANGQGSNVGSLKAVPQLTSSSSLQQQFVGSVNPSLVPTMLFKKTGISITAEQLQETLRFPDDVKSSIMGSPDAANEIPVSVSLGNIKAVKKQTREASKHQPKSSGATSG